MIILGIDPGTSRLGWAVLKSKKEEIVPLKYGCFEFDGSSNEKLLKISKNVERLIKTYRPKIIAIEKIFFFKNAKTAMSISEAKGVILLMAQKNKIQTIELTPLEIKQYLIGYGRANKKDIQKTIQYFFCLDSLPKPDDTSDAIAVALAGLHKYLNQ
ncbi:MAG: crossover junction endodeoxyribonuclease RuvC [Candidatus Paceibacterota bacterium]